MQGIQRYYPNQKYRQTHPNAFKRGGRMGGGTPSGQFERRVTSFMVYYTQVNQDGK